MGITFNLYACHKKERRFCQSNQNQGTFHNVNLPFGLKKKRYSNTNIQLQLHNQQSEIIQLYTKIIHEQGDSKIIQSSQIWTNDGTR